MSRQWKQVLVAMILGLILPGLMLNFGISGQTQQKPEPTHTMTTKPTEPQQTEATHQEAVYIPVQTGNGKVMVMKLEEYILGVVLAEMPASFEPEALKAQAVVARTYAIRRMQLKDKHQNAICTDSTCCQAYIPKEAYLENGGYRTDVAKVTQAVRETAGQILTYEGQLAETTYFSCSGGRTEDAAAVWGTDIAYLQAVDSPGEKNSENITFFTAEEFCRALGRKLEGSPDSWLGKVTYTAGGGVDMMFVGGISYPGTQLRQTLELNSTAFTMTAENGGITVTTRGKGHRVGMSQYGADAMAVVGKGYAQILSHYYPGTEIDKLSDIE